MFAKTVLVIAIGILMLAPNVVKSDGFHLIHQYYECKYLTMYLYNFSNHYFYLRNASIPNNSLADTFYQQLGLLSMTFDQAMTFVRKIYTDTKSSSNTYLANCTRFGVGGEALNYYNAYFATDTNFAKFKKIHSAFNLKFNNQAYMKSLNDSFQNNYLASFYPTLLQFIMKYDFTYGKIDYYKNLSLVAYNYSAVNYSVSFSKLKLNNFLLLFLVFNFYFLI